METKKLMISEEFKQRVVYDLAKILFKKFNKIWGFNGSLHLFLIKQYFASLILLAAKIQSKIENYQKAKRRIDPFRNSMVYILVKQATYPASLWVCNLNKALSKEVLAKEFQKYGRLKRIRFNSQKNMALISYEKENEAKIAEKNLDSSKIFEKMVYLSSYFDKESSQKEKNFNLFIKNVPPKLKTNDLHQFLVSNFGEIDSLTLKKNETGDSNLGYGQVQFEKEEDCQKILKMQELQGKINIQKLSCSFNVEPFGEKSEIKSNTILITGFYEYGVPKEEEEAKLHQIQKVFEEVKNNIGAKYQLKHFSQYIEEKNNFQTYIKFNYQDENDEETVNKAVKNAVFSNFPYSSPQKQPTIKFQEQVATERKLIFVGIKKTVNEDILADWILSHLQISVSKQNIKIKSFCPTPYHLSHSQHPNYSATLLFDSKQQGERALIYFSKKQNKEIVLEILESSHQVNIFVSQEELEEINKKSNNMKDFYQKKKLDHQNKKKLEAPSRNPQQFLPPKKNQIPNCSYDSNQYFTINNMNHPSQTQTNFKNINTQLNGYSTFISTNQNDQNQQQEQRKKQQFQQKQKQQQQQKQQQSYQQQQQQQQQQQLQQQEKQQKQQGKQQQQQGKQQQQQGKMLWVRKPSNQGGICEDL